MKKRKRREEKEINVGTTVSFRPMSAEFVARFNLALKVTGMNVNDLVQRSVDGGMNGVVQEVMRERHQAEGEFLKTLKPSPDHEGPLKAPR